MFILKSLLSLDIFLDGCMLWDTTATVWIIPIHINILDDKDIIFQEN